MPDAASPTGPVQSQPRGAHWVAWFSGADGKPERSVVVVGQTQEEAEAHARLWAAQNQRSQ
jgi:hypothetical protein